MNRCTTTWGLQSTEKPKKLKIELDKLGSTQSRSLKRQHPLTAETLEKIDSKLPCFDPKVKRLETLQYLKKELLQLFLNRGKIVKTFDEEISEEN